MLLNKRLNLQLFAEDDEEEIEDGGLKSEEEETEEELEADEPEDEPEEEESEEEEEEDEPDKKKEKAIIKYKKKYKETEQRLKQLEQQLEEKEAKEREVLRLQELKKEGKTEDEAARIVANESELNTLRTKVMNQEYELLEDAYPGIKSYKWDIEKILKNNPDMTREEIYFAKFNKNASFEQKRNLEAQLQYKQKLARSKSSTNRETSEDTDVRMTKAEAVAYREVKKYNPGLSKKEFLKSLNEEEEIDY